MSGSTDEEWERWAQQDPYFSVLTHPKFRSQVLDEAALDEFFGSGTEHVAEVLDYCRVQFDPSFEPQRVLDFGCGTGRLLPAFAARGASVVGVDVSASMLDEARRNCDRLDASKVRLVRGDDQLSQVDGTFDLIHSVIVFQHIPTDRGRVIFKGMLAKLRPGGIGAIQVTYANWAFANSYGTPAEAVPAVGVRQSAREFLAAGRSLGLSIAERLRPKPVRSGDADPEMQMNHYRLNDLLFLCQEAGIGRVHVEFTDHGGELGVFLYFQRPAG